MKRQSDLYDRIWLLDNLKLALKKAAKGKRQQNVVRRFERNLTTNLVNMRDAVIAGCYPFGQFHCFTIHDPKQRVIHACCFEERVLHHAIMNVCHSSFDRRLIFDTFACRVGKGRLAAINRAQEHCRKYTYYLKLDISQYFNTISHRVLKRQVCRLFKEPPLLELFFSIIDTYHSSAEKGLPIGTLTSQYFANHYLSGLDRYIKENLSTPAYVRYMDDFILWHDDASQLKEWIEAIESYVNAPLALKLHPQRKIAQCSEGLPFLGLRLNAHSKWLARRGRRNYQSRIIQYEKDCARGLITAYELQRRFDALHAASCFADRLEWRNRFWRNRKALAC